MEQLEQNTNEITDFKNLSGGLEVLVQLAEKGEIDPWDINIIEVTNKYLDALDKSPRENLLNAGRAIFFASVLLRLKSEVLLSISNETLLNSQQTEDFFPEDSLFSDSNNPPLDLSRLESFLVRSSLGKQQRKRKISLKDLIFALQQAEEEEDRRALRAKLRANRVITIITPEMSDSIFELAHEEDIDEYVEKIEAIIQEHLTNEKPISLTLLSELLNSKTKPFVALLFLAHSKKVVLEQNEFYGEVLIHRAGTILEEKQEEEIIEKKPVVKSKKKNIIDKIKKIKDRIFGKSDGDNKKEGLEIIEMGTKNESEVIIDGNHNTNE